MPAGYWVAKNRPRDIKIYKEGIKNCGEIFADLHIHIGRSKAGL